jgi:hypothetical protein
MGDFLDQMKKSGKAPTEVALVGWINADLAYQGLKAAGPSFTRQSVIDATNKMTAYSAGGLVNPIDWTRQHEPWTAADPVTHNSPNECTALVQVKNGKFVLVGNKDKPFNCWKNSSQAWSPPTYTDFP